MPNGDRADEFKIKSYDLEYWGGPMDGKPLGPFGYPYGATIWLSTEGYYRMELRKMGDEQRIGAVWHEEHCESVDPTSI